MKFICGTRRRGTAAPGRESASSDTVLRQAISGQVQQQLSQGKLDVGFYLANNDELKKVNLSTIDSTFLMPNTRKVHVFTAQPATKLIATPLTQLTAAGQRYSLSTGAGCGIRAAS